MIHTEWDMLVLSMVALIIVILHAAGKCPLWPAVLVNTFILAIARMLGKI